MIYNLSLIIVSQLSKKGHLLEEDKEVVTFGIFSLLFNSYCTLFCLSLGAFLHCFSKAIIFLLSFLFIKKYSGGFHASSEGRCLLVSSMGITFSLFLIKLCLINTKTHCLLLIIALILSVFIMCFSPIESKNKPIEDENKKKYKTFSIIRIIAIVCFIFVLEFMKQTNISIPFIVSIVFEGVLSIAGKIQMKRNECAVL